MPFLINDFLEKEFKTLRPVYDKHIKFFTIVELSPFSLLFILEAAFLENDSKSDKKPYECRFFLINSIDEALSIISDNKNVVGHRLSLFLDRNETKNSDHEISTIEEIYISSDDTGHQVHLFICQNGLTHVKYCRANHSKGNSKKEQCVYKRKDYNQSAELLIN